MRRIVGGLGVAMMICVFIAGFIAYFIYHTDPDTNVMYDGFGRPLSESPFLVRLLFGEERLWPGWFWSIGDIVIFWGGIFIGSLVMGWGFKEPSTRKSE